MSKRDDFINKPDLLTLYSVSEIHKFCLVLKTLCDFKTFFFSFLTVQGQWNLKNGDRDFLFWRICTLITMNSQTCLHLQAWQGSKSKASDFCDCFICFICFF